MKRHSGQSLIEMIVVIGVVVLLATGIVAGTTASLAATQQNQLRAKALRLAQQGIELTRALRDAGWNSFSRMGTAPSVYCVGEDGAFTISSSACTAPTLEGLYIRSVSLTLTGGVMAVDSAVSWGNTSASKNTVELKTTLTQWQ